MVSHLRLDAEFLGIVGLAVAASLLVTGRAVSNTLFSALIVSLFFLMGLHLDRKKLRSNLHRTREVALGLALVYLAVPAVALAGTTVFEGALSDALVAIGASTAAIGSPTVFSNLGKGEDGTALVLSASTVFVGVFGVPLVAVLMGADVPLLEFAARNFGLLGVPLLLGLAAQGYENFLFEDMRHHFSKLALWLLALVFGVQLKLSLGSGVFRPAQLAAGVPVLLALVGVSYGMGYTASKLAGFPVRQRRSFGFVTGSKGIAVAVFVASQLSGGAVVFVSMYYFIRQIALGSLAELYSKNSDLLSKLGISGAKLKEYSGR